MQPVARDRGGGAAATATAHAAADMRGAARHLLAREPVDVAHHSRGARTQRRRPLGGRSRLGRGIRVRHLGGHEHDHHCPNHPTVLSPEEVVVAEMARDDLTAAFVVPPCDVIAFIRN